MNSKKIAEEIAGESNWDDYGSEVVKIANDYLDLLAKMEGCVLVPVKPTSQTIKAMEWQLGGTEGDPVKTWGTTLAIYNAAIGVTK